MLLSPPDYYSPYEKVVSKSKEFEGFSESVEDFAVSKGMKAYWRGQADHTWPLSSSLARVAAGVGPLSDDIVNVAEDRILEEARGWISELSDPLYKTDLAALAYLQHHGIPTRLIDFTSDSGVALFFACESQPKVDGRVFALLVDNGDTLDGQVDGQPWRDYKIDDLKVWDPVSAGLGFPRLVAQNGMFAVGRLPSTKPMRKATDPYLGRERERLAEEVRSILSIPFRLSPYSKLPHKAKSPIGFTARVHINKASVMRQLSDARWGMRVITGNRVVSHKSVYPDASGMASSSELLAGLRRGVLFSGDGA